MTRRLTDEARAKMSAAAKAQMADPTARTRLSEANRGENNPMFGRKLSEETRAKMRGRKPSPEARKKMADARRAHPVSDETRAKLSAAMKGRKWPEERRARMSAATKAAWAKRRAAAANQEGDEK